MATRVSKRQPNVSKLKWLFNSKMALYKKRYLPVLRRFGISNNQLSMIIGDTEGLVAKAKSLKQFNRTKLSKMIEANQKTLLAIAGRGL